MIHGKTGYVFKTSVCNAAAHWQKLRQQAWTDGDFNITGAAAAFPVVIRPQGPNEWEPLQWDLVKELRKTVMHNGIGAPFTQNLLQSIMKGHLLIPYDLKSLADLILTPTQKVLWLTHWKDLCEIEAMSNLNKPLGDPLRGAGISQLMGEAPVNTPQLQARLPAEVLQQSADLAYQAMLKVPDTGKPVKSFTHIKQGTEESYMQFIDRLQEAIHKQVQQPEAKEALLLQLAVENANEDCKRVLRALPHPNIVQMIEACNRVESTTYKNEAFAVTLATALRANNKVCFRCGEPGLFKKACPNGPTPAGVSGGNSQPPGICPCCRKGRPYANQCKSKYDASGRLLSGNGKRSAKGGCAQTQVSPTVPARHQCQQAWVASKPGPPGVPEWMLPNSLFPYQL